MAMLPKLLYEVDAIPFKIPADCFVETDELTLEFIWNRKKSPIAKTILKDKNKAGKLTFLDFKTYCRAAIIETVWHETGETDTLRKQH